MIQNSGLKVKRRDPRIFSHAKAFGAPPILKYEEFDLFPDLKVKSQGQTDACTGFAVTSALAFRVKQDNSPEYHFYKTKLLEGNWTSYGANQDDACKVAVKSGLLLSELSPYSFDREDRNTIANPFSWVGKENLDIEAAKHKQLAYYEAD